MFKRAGLSVFKNKVRSFVYLVILVAISSLILTGLSIKASTTKATEQARLELNPTISFNFNYDKIINDLVDEGYNIEEAYAELKSNRRNYNVPMTKDYLVDLSESDYVQGYNYSIYQSLISSSLKILDSDYNIIDQEQSVLMSTASIVPISDFEGNNTLVEGNAFDEGDTSKVIISQMLAEKNGLSIGDEIDLSSYVVNYQWVLEDQVIPALLDENGDLLYDEENRLVIPEGVNVFTWSFEESIVVNQESEMLFEIVGLYESENVFFDHTILNRVFIPMSDIEKFLDDPDSDELTVFNARIFIDDPENVSAFYEEIGSIEGESAKGRATQLTEDENFVLVDNNATYEAMVKPLNSLGDFIDFILVVIIAAGALIIMLLIGNSMKDRKYEIGVLLSLGEEKIKIALQYMIEMLAIGMIAFIISIGASNLVANDLGNTLLKNNIEDTSTQTPSKGGGKGRVDVEMIDEIDVAVKPNEILLMFLIGTGLIVASSIVPSLYISMYQPKKILSSGN